MGWLKDIFDIAKDLIRERKEAHKKATISRTESESVGEDAPVEASREPGFQGSHGITWEEYQRLFDIEG